ncbi:SPOR domain-containing protein [Neisseriaceae bacterium ESL0693]|nr:SPOR domain-containing protein [Neisseriaceae bacterium ESL0693]
MNPQNDYEQLKRRNRRRLAGAIVMVIIAGVVLLTVINRHSSEPIPAPDVAITSESSASAVENEPSAPVASEAVPAASAATASIPANTPAASAGHDDKNITTRQQTLPQPVLVPAETGKRDLPQQPVTAEPTVVIKPAERASVVQSSADRQPDNTRRPAMSVTPTAPVNVSSKPALEVKKATVTDKNVEMATAKKTPVKPATHAPVQAKPEQTTSVTKPADTVKTQNKAALTPQQILDNNAAAILQAKTTAQTEHSAGNSTQSAAMNNARVLIQIGAYTTQMQAQAIQQKLASAGIKVQVIPSQTNRGTLYRVRTGVYGSRTEAQQQLNKIHAAGVDGLIMTQ